MPKNIYLTLNQQTQRPFIQISKLPLTHFITQLIYNNTNNKNVFYHYILHKPYTHTILISLKHVFNQAS
jgi:hypothetical protein